VKEAVCQVRGLTSEAVYSTKKDGLRNDTGKVRKRPLDGLAGKGVCGKKRPMDVMSSEYERMRGRCRVGG